MPVGRRSGAANTLLAVAILFAGLSCGHDEPPLDTGAMSGPVHIERVTEQNSDQNAFVIWAKPKGDCWIVDPGLPPSAKQILACVRERQLTPVAILLTHGHMDHIAGVPEIRQAFPKAAVYIAKEDKAALTDPKANMSNSVKIPFTTGVFDSQDLPASGERSLDGVAWKILDTSGHTPGGRSFYCPAAKTVIVGDALFAGSVGRTDLPEGDGKRLIRNLRENLLSLPDDTTVLCGHGAKTTIGEERKNNPFLQPEPVAKPKKKAKDKTPTAHKKEPSKKKTQKKPTSEERPGKP